MNDRRQMAHIPEGPSRASDALHLVLFLLVCGAIIVALCAVDPGVR